MFHFGICLFTVDFGLARYFLSDQIFSQGGFSSFRQALDSTYIMRSVPVLLLELSSILLNAALNQVRHGLSGLQRCRIKERGSEPPQDKVAAIRCGAIRFQVLVLVANGENGFHHFEGIRVDLRVGVV
jgi:hypothetical protein